MSTAGKLSGRFYVNRLEIPGVVTVQRMRRGDDRGSFVRLFCPKDLQVAGWEAPIAQINHSHTVQKGTVRGLHFQKDPYTEIKLVTCIRGRVWDVAVDLRPASPTYLRWCAHEISAANETAMLIPAGCAHGFQTLTDDAELLYLHSQPHVPEAEAGIHPLDPTIAVAWPLPIALMSDRDAHSPLLGSADNLKS